VGLTIFVTLISGGLAGIGAKLAPALAKIPLVGNIMSWIATSFDNLLAPARGKIGEFFSGLWIALKEGVTKGLKGLIDESPILASWIGKFKGIWNGVSTTFTQNISILKAKIATFAENVVKTLGKPFEGFAKVVDGSIKSVKGMFDGLWTKVKEIAGLVKDKVTNMLTGIKIPKISLNTGTKTIMGKTITYPKGFDISWHKEGAIIRGTQGGTIVGMAEGGGDEAILPLSNFNRMKPFAKAVADFMPKANLPQGIVGGEIVIHVNSILDGKQIAESTIKVTQELLADITKKQNRLSGLYA
jgi:hypothetical protein